MKVLLSAYACEPGKGSEPEVGLRTMLAAAREHDVWVVTRNNNLASLREYLATDPLRDRIHLVGLDVPGPLLRHKKRHPIVAQLYYDQWQRALARRAVELHDQVGFDVAHHVTFAAYWKRAGVAAVPIPLVWGPVGGGVTTPLRLCGELGGRGIIAEVARSVARPLVARLPSLRVPQHEAAVILTQNPETARRMNPGVEPIVLPNALAIDVPDSAAPSTRDFTVVTVARLVPWKGVALAIRAFADVSDPAARMIVIGRGNQRDRLERLAKDLGVRQRVTFAGQIPREQVLRTVAGARVLLHAAVHEEAGLAVSEALSYGTPVVCLDRGGPPVLLDHWPQIRSAAIAPTGSKSVAAEMANAIDAVLRDDPPEPGRVRPTTNFGDRVLASYRTAVATPHLRRSTPT